MAKPSVTTQRNSYWNCGWRCFKAVSANFVNLTCLVVKSTGQKQYKRAIELFFEGGVPHRIIGNQVNIF